MNRSLTDQIRDYFEAVDREQGAVDVAAVLRRVEESEVVMLDVSQVDPPPARRPSRWVGSLAAAAVVAVVVAGLAVTRIGDEAPDAADTTVTPSDPSLTAEDALAVADEYYERYNAGDVGGQLALFASDATFSYDWCCGGDVYNRDEFAVYLEWNAAQGSRLVNRSCAVPSRPAQPTTRPGSASDPVTVVCEVGDQDAITSAGGLDPVPITFTWVISVEGIHQWKRLIGSPDYGACCADFHRWIASNHPADADAVSVPPGDDATIESARALGELLAQRAAEWAATLDSTVDTDVTPTEPVSTEPPAATTVTLSSSDSAAADPPTDLVATEVAPSSIGDLRWSAISIDPALIEAGGIVPTPTGFAAVRADGQLLLSDDAIEWRSVVSPFPGRINELSVAGQGVQGPQHPQAVEFHIDTTEGSWVSSDFVTWSRTAAVQAPHKHRPGGAAPPGLTEWMTGPEFLEVGFRSADGAHAFRHPAHVVETPDGAQLVHADWRIDWDTLVLQVGGEPLRQRLADGAVLFENFNSWDPTTGIVTPALYASEEDLDTAITASDHNQAFERPPSGVQIRLSISGTVDDWVIVLEDVARGETLGSITGSLPALGNDDPATQLSRVTLDDTLELLAGGGGGLGATFLWSGDRLELVEPPPWVSLPGSAPKFVVTDDALYAYYDSGAWRSADGRTWQALTSRVFPTIHQFFTGPGGVVVAAVIQPGVGTDSYRRELQRGSLLLRSEDGINWAPPSRPPVLTTDQIWFSHLAADESGFVYLAYETGLKVWTSNDGDIWERVDAPIPIDLGPDPRQGSAAHMRVTSSGTVVILAAAHIEGTPAPTTAWIIERVATQ